MSKKRHSAGKWNPAPSHLIVAFSADFPNGHTIDEHTHGWDQLIYASNGVMSVYTPGGAWIVPPHRAVWVPAGIKHRIQMSGAVSMRTLYFRTRLMQKQFPNECFVINISPLLRELILHAAKLRNLDSKVDAHKRFIGVMLDQLAAVSSVPLQLPLPADPRALKAAQLLLSNPGKSASLERVSKMAGAGKRTIERLFLSETGMVFNRWRQQARLLYALRLLAAGSDVTGVALAVGYDSTSAFIAMFRQTFGITPGRYFKSTA
jgi:AraC-like DNA-binding protein